MANSKSQFFSKAEPLPLCYQVPEIRIRREWPYFSDSQIENPYSQENIVSAIEITWFKLADSTEPIDSNEFWGATSEYLHDDGERVDMYRGDTGHPMIAISNYRQIENTLSDLLPRLKAKTNPTTDVLLTMFRESLDAYNTAWHIAYHDKDDAGAIAYLESQRREVASTLKPMMLMFFASLRATPTPDDEPIGPFTRSRWAKLLDYSERTVQGMKRHPASSKGKIYFAREFLPPDIDQRIANGNGTGKNAQQRAK